MTDLHLAFLAFSAVVILYSDHMGLRYFLGKTQTVPAKKMKIAHRLVWTGLLGMIGTGAFLFWPARDYYLQDPAFLTKMGFVGVLVINGLFIGNLLHTATITPFRELSSLQKVMLLVSGGASATGWVGSALIGFLWL